jgi:hypothetical protein
MAIGRHVPPSSSGLITEFPKIFRTAAPSGCQISQVKAIRAAARFSYLLFLRVRCPNPFFWHPSPAAGPTISHATLETYVRGKCVYRAPAGGVQL